jgi:hypothetical protein
MIRELQGGDSGRRADNLKDIEKLKLRHFIR